MSRSTKENTRTGKDFQTETNQYAKRVIASMRDDLAALAHAQECNGETENGKPCKRGQETRTYTDKTTGEKRKQMKHDDPEAWHDEERARERIQEGPLSIQVRGDWHTPGDEEGNTPTEYEILLGTGGPAHRIIGDLDQYKQPETATFQYQDWFKPWTDAELSPEDAETLLEYAQQFYFGE